ncbi:hypothetical protein [Streptomyces sp. enrichment culture]
MPLIIATGSSADPVTRWAIRSTAATSSAPPGAGGEDLLTRIRLAG